MGEEQGNSGSRHAASAGGALARGAMLCRAKPCRAGLCRGSHASEQGSDHFSRCRSRGVGFHERSGAGLSGQAKLLAGWRQKATEQV